ncbi:unnamed protein product [Strongylus vulgaris]|uniref:EGF-like domain-containing protein n=1 Tax=Strongylus vulgaris TaxID=40348 RepID=A0A3P7LUQ0_STRVU|nr:unnamed protein product [Strongylus vulgaris]
MVVNDVVRTSTARAIGPDTGIASAWLDSSAALRQDSAAIQAHVRPTSLTLAMFANEKNAFLMVISSLVNATRTKDDILGSRISVKNECLTGENDCDRSARCIDTDDGYLCACPSGFIDRSADPVSKPGRLCVAEQNECLDGTHK